MDADRPPGRRGRRRRTVIDVKVKKRHVAQADADSDPQPSLYLLERALAGRPAPRFLYHSLNPAAKAKTKVVATHRTRAQLEAFVARILATARAIDGLNRTFGPRRAVAAGRPDPLVLLAALLRRLGAPPRRRRASPPPPRSPAATTST